MNVVSSSLKMLFLTEALMFPPGCGPSGAGGPADGWMDRVLPAALLFPSPAMGWVSVWLERASPVDHKPPAS